MPKADRTARKKQQASKEQRAGEERQVGKRQQTGKRRQADKKQQQTWWDPRAQLLLVGASVLLFCTGMIGTFMLVDDGLILLIAGANKVLSVVCGLVYLIPELTFSWRKFGFDVRSLPVLIVCVALINLDLTGADTLLVVVLVMSLVLIRLTRLAFGANKHQLFEIPSELFLFARWHTLALLGAALLVGVAPSLLGQLGQDTNWSARALTLAAIAFPHGVVATVNIATHAVAVRDKATGVPNTGWESVQNDSYAYARVRTFLVLSCGSKVLTVALALLDIVGMSLASLIEAVVLLVVAIASMRLTKGMPSTKGNKRSNR